MHYGLSVYNVINVRNSWYIWLVKCHKLKNFIIPPDETIANLSIDHLYIDNISCTFFSLYIQYICKLFDAEY